MCKCLRAEEWRQSVKIKGQRSAAGGGGGACLKFLCDWLLISVCVCVYLYFKPNPSPPLYVCVWVCLSLCACLRRCRCCQASFPWRPALQLWLFTCHAARSLSHTMFLACVCVCLPPPSAACCFDRQSEVSTACTHTHTRTHTTNVSVMTAFTHCLCKKNLITIRPPGGTKTRTVLLH